MGCKGKQITWFRTMTMSATALEGTGNDSQYDTYACKNIMLEMAVELKLYQLCLRTPPMKDLHCNGLHIAI